MILDKQIRESVTQLLKEYTPLVDLVGENNIYDFPARKIDSKYLPAVSVLTLRANDASDTNDEYSDTILSLVVEIAGKTIDSVETIEQHIDDAVVNSSQFVTGVGFRGVSEVQYLRYSSSESFYDDDGKTVRFVKAVQYDSRYQSMKGKILEPVPLDSIEMEIKAEDKEDSQIDNITVIQL